MSEIFIKSLPYYTYCEQAGDAFQPLNVASNIVFFLIALWLWRADENVPNRKLLAGLFFIAGSASAVWHTTAHQFALFGDIISVFVLMAAVMFIVFRDLLGMKKIVALGATLAVVVLSILCKDIGKPLLQQDSGAFIPAVVVLVFVGGLMLKQKTVMIALMVSALSLGLAISSRSLDMEVCTVFPFGLHFVWHIFSVASVFLVLLALREYKAIKP